MITLAEMRAFIAVAERGDLQSAAELIGRSPAAVSMSLKQLSERLGAALFEGPRKNVLTPIGRQVLEEVHDLAVHHDRSWAAIQSFIHNQIGVCDVAGLFSIAVALFPDVVLRLRRVAPIFRINLSEANSRAIKEGLSAGLYEIGFLSLPIVAADLQFTPLFKDQLDLVCRSDSPFTSHRRAVRWDDLVGHPFLANGSYGVPINPVFQAIEQASTIHIQNVGSLLAMVRAGTGVTVLPRLLREQAGPGLCFLPVAEETAFRTVGLANKANREMTLASRHFVSSAVALIIERAEALGYDAADARSVEQQFGTCQRL